MEWLDFGVGMNGGVKVCMIYFIVSPCPDRLLSVCPLRNPDLCLPTRGMDVPIVGIKLDKYFISFSSCIYFVSRGLNLQKDIAQSMFKETLQLSHEK